MSTGDDRPAVPAPRRAGLHPFHGGVFDLSRRLAIFSVIFLGWLLMVLFTRTMNLRFDHDEHQFVASGVLLAQDGLLPYRDFPYFHMPNLALVYAALFRLTDYYLLAARIFSVICAWLLLAVIYGVALRLWRGSSDLQRGMLAAGSALLLGATPLLVYTSGRAWNHDLPVLLAVVAYLVQMRAQRRRASRWWFLLSGFLIGFAAATRLTYALLAVPLLLAIVGWDAGPGAKGGRRASSVLLFVTGMLVAGLPALYFLFAETERFLFGNLEYARLNMLYQLAAGFDRRMTLLDKLSYFLRDVLLFQPGNLILVGAYVWLGLPPWRRGAPMRAELWLLGGAVAATFAGALAPTPSWPQYYFALLPFCALAALVGLRYRHPAWPAQRWFQVTAIGAVVIAVALVTREHIPRGLLAAPQKWIPVEIHQIGQQIAALSGPGSRVLTVAPALALEGGNRIYPELAAGPFPLRVAPLLTPEQRAFHQMIAPEDLAGWLAAQPPAALLTGVHSADADTEAPIVAWGQAQAYAPFVLDNGETLWLRPRAQWGDAVHLVTTTGLPGAVMPDEPLTVTLFLRSVGPIDANLNVMVRLVGADGAVLVQQDGWPWGRPTATWQLGEIWYDGHQLSLPATASPGLYRLEVDFYDPAAGAHLPVTDLHTGARQETPFVAGYTVVGAWPPAPATALAPPPQFRDLTQLVGSDLRVAGATAATAPAVVHPGETVEVRLHWQTLKPQDSDFTAFVHMVGPDGQLVAQHDKQPLDGFYPTSRWQAEESLADNFTLTMPDTALPGAYTLRAGFYGTDGQRLAVTTGGQPQGDFATVGTVIVQ